MKSLKTLRRKIKFQLYTTNHKTKNMQTIVKYTVAAAIALFSLISCDGSKSLQSYIVDKQEDDRFMKVDLATSLLANLDSIPSDQKEVLNTVKKMNVVAYPKSEGTDADYKVEKAKLDLIFNQEKYKVLGSFNKNNQNMKLMYLGDEEAIDEVIIYGRDDEKGLAVFRLLGDKMNPASMMKLATTLEDGDLNLSQLAGLEDIFNKE